jgi:hypothetical protein
MISFLHASEKDAVSIRGISIYTFEVKLKPFQNLRILTSSGAVKSKLFTN